MDNHDITSIMNATMAKIKELVDTNTVVGKAIDAGRRFNGLAHHGVRVEDQ